MINVTAILKLLGQLLLVLSGSMTIPLIMDVIILDQRWVNFAIAIAITGFIGIICLITTPNFNRKLSLRDGFLMIILAWNIIPIFAAIPLILNLPKYSFTDMIFESVSGLTTTGATVITGLDKLDKGLLLWRSILQWLGGIATVLMAVVLMPKLGVGGMQLFLAEMTDRNEKAMPKSTQVARWIFSVYLGLTVLSYIAYQVGGMSSFDALNHAMTSIATGGFSTYDASFGQFKAHNELIWIAIGIMIAGSLPFILYVKALRGNPTKILYDQQVQFFLGLLFLFIFIMIIHQIWCSKESWKEIIPAVTFNVTSIMTGTGYVSSAYDTWGELAIPFFFVIMVIGGCAGSTSCGIKIFRFVVLKEAARVQLNRLLNPNGVFIAYYNGKPIEASIADSVQGFFLLFGVTFVLLSWGLAMTELDFLTAMSAASSAIANVGPGLGYVVGPQGNFASLSIVAKWIMIIGMLVGRMEIYTVLIVLLPQFWRN